MIVSGEVSILPGEYRVMVYAFGTESTLISKYDSWKGCTAYTDALSQEYLKTLSLKSSLDEQPIHFQPDHLLAARSEYESIPWHSGSHVIHSVASSVVESYYLQIKVQGLEYVSSAGLRVLLLLHKQMLAEEGLTIININETVREVLEITGFLDILNVEENTVEES
jgi:anti-anti-sigma factor